MEDKRASEELQRIARELASITAPVTRELAALQNQSPALAAAVLSVTEAVRLSDSTLASIDRVLASQNAALLKTSYEPILEANRSFARMLQAETIQASIGPDTLEALARLQEVPARLKLDQSFAAALLKLGGSRTFAASLVAQGSLAELSRHSVGSLIGADSTFRRSTAAHMGRVSRSYSALLGATADSSSQTALTAVVTATAPVEYYRHVQALRSVTVEGADAYSSETVEAAVDAGAPTVEQLLAQIDNSLIPLLEGARRSAESRNPDRPRHVTTSLRELITQTLHALAPDEAIAEWSSDPRHFANGKPTRRARLLYICRCIDEEPLGDFVKADVSAAIAFIDSLNAGTHTVQSRLTDGQLHAQVARTESLLVFLVQLVASDQAPT